MNYEAVHIVRHCQIAGGCGGDARCGLRETSGPLEARDYSVEVLEVGFGI